LTARGRAGPTSADARRNRGHPSRRRVPTWRPSRCLRQRDQSGNLPAVDGRGRAFAAYPDRRALQRENIGPRDRRRASRVRDGLGRNVRRRVLAFNEGWMAAVLPYLCDGGVCGAFIDWRGYPTVFAAASKLRLIPLNLIVWAKRRSCSRVAESAVMLFQVNVVSLAKIAKAVGFCGRDNVDACPRRQSLGKRKRRSRRSYS